MKKTKKNHTKPNEEEVRGPKKPKSKKQDPKQERLYRKRPIRYFLDEEE